MFSRHAAGSPTSFILLLLAVLMTLAAGSALAATRAALISDSGSLLSGPEAEGQLGDYILQNDQVTVIISALGHLTHSGVNGGTVIDAAETASGIDALGEFYTYFDDDWPRQAVYTTLAILDDGGQGGPALIQVTGQDSENPAMTVITDYSLAQGQAQLEITTSVTNTSGSTISSFELGDAFHWGICTKFAPGYGPDVNGTTTQAWMVGQSDNVSYGYAGRYGDCFGPNGGYWSDLSVRTVTINAGATAYYERHLSIGSGDVASALTPLLMALGTSTGTLNCRITDVDTDLPINGATVAVYDAMGSYYLPMTTDNDGWATCQLPAGTWRLDVTAAAYVGQETWLTLGDGLTELREFTLQSAGTGGTAIGDTLTVLQRPLVNIPAIVKPGQVLPLSCSAAPTTTGWQAEITYEGLTLPLAISSANYDPATLWWTVSTIVPDVPLYALYDLRVTADGGLDDLERNAVQVIEDFRDDYYFIHITDTHLPDHQFSNSGAAPADSSESVDLREVIHDINIINPEFVLLTGDLINEGELEDYLEWRAFTRAKRQLAEFETPLYLTAGNHDIGGWTSTPPPDGTARRNWWRFFGWPRLDSPPPGAPSYTQNYSFDYGDVHYTALESYNNYDSWRPEIYGDDSFRSDQLTWLNADLSAASGSLAQVLFYHYDFQHQLNLGSLGVDMALSGHTHSDRGSLDQPPYDIGTNNVCEERSYRLIRVSDGVLTPLETLAAGSNGQNLRVAWAPANNGFNDTVTANIVNNQPQRFENGRLRFVMPHRPGGYVATGGQIVQEDNSGDFTICHIAVDILANHTLTVTVEPNLIAVPDLPDGRLVRLGQNHPNPFNPLTKLDFHLPLSSQVQVGVYDMQGHEVVTLVKGHLEAGDHTVQWNGCDGAGRDMASGVYLVRLTTPQQTKARKIVLAR